MDEMVVVERPAASLVEHSASDVVLNLQSSTE